MAIAPMRMAGRTCRSFTRESFRSCAVVIKRLLTKRPGKVNRVPSLEMKTHFHSLGAVAAFALGILLPVYAQAPPPPDAPEVVDFSKLIPLLPDAPSGWTADKPDGSHSDGGGFKLTNVHRDFRKGEGNNAPSAAISILDSVSNPDYVIATTAAWNLNSESTEGYSKSVTFDGNPGFTAYEKDKKNGS